MLKFGRFKTRERSHSGLVRLRAKELTPQGVRGFESHPLRSGMSIKSFIENWKRGRLKKAEARKRLEELFDKFLLETKPLTPRAPKHQEAALYRHAWKRAIALSFLFDKTSNSEKSELYKNFIQIAARRYSRVAPHNLYGRVSLKMSLDAILKLAEQEKRMLLADMSDDTFSEKFDMPI